MKNIGNLGKVTLTAAAACGLLLVAAPAWGHAAFKASDPADESTISSPPAQVWAEYTEPPAEGSYIHVTDPCGERVEIGSPNLTGYRMTVDVAADKAGTYTADWFAFSKLDPHTTTGAFTFTVTGGEPCPGSENEGGGGGNRGSGSSATGGGGGGTASEGSNVDIGSGSNSGEGSAGTSARERSERGAGRRGDGARRSGGRGRNAPGEFGFAASPDEPETPPVWEGIPLTPFLVGLGLSALIGAAGGKMYAGIVNPRR